MSHFVVLVVVPKDRKEMVHELLAPYDESIRVPEYEEKCYCVGLKAKTDAKEAARKVFGTEGNIKQSIEERDDIKELRAKGRELLSKEFIELQKLSDAEVALRKNIDSIIEQEMEIAFKPFNEYFETAHKQHPMKDKPDPACSECNGTGIVMSTYNPKTRWDWYEVGGRWNDFLELGNNYAPIPDFIKALKEREDCVYAIVTPDGEWHQRGEMGWWGMSSNEDKDWDEKMFKILEGYDNVEYIGVIVDCHI